KCCTQSYSPDCFKVFHGVAPFGMVVCFNFSACNASTTVPKRFPANNSGFPYRPVTVAISLFCVILQIKKILFSGEKALNCSPAETAGSGAIMEERLSHIVIWMV
ncbi:MAG: hypothetical protein HGA99_08355, partial [Chlorobiaceae bacterium]|nr:hypothetical protein [Chlorobiaceae bacterium]